MKLDYVDIFYSHRFDPNTPLEETMGALDTAVRQGKALYVGISSYTMRRQRRRPPSSGGSARRRSSTSRAIPCSTAGPSATSCSTGWKPKAWAASCFRRCAQGVLTDRYLEGIPADSRAAGGRFLKAASITDKNVARVRALKAIAERRGQTVAQLALAWVLRDPRMTSALIGASRPEQVRDAVGALANLAFTREELAEIDRHAVEGA